MIQVNSFVCVCIYICVYLLQNSYNLGKTEFDVSASVIPGGDYHIIADITMNGAQATCIDMYISVA